MTFKSPRSRVRERRTVSTNPVKLSSLKLTNLGSIDSSNIINLRLYKEFFFNRKYADVGTFAYPAVVAYVPITVLSFFVFFAEMLRMLYDGMTSAAYFAFYWQWGQPFDPLYIGNELVIFASFLAIYLVFLALSMSLIGERYTLSKVPGTLMVLFVYPLVNSAFYALSLYKEIAGSEYQW